MRERVALSLGRGAEMMRKRLALSLGRGWRRARSRSRGVCGWVLVYMGHWGWLDNSGANPTVVFRASTNRDRIFRTA